MKAVIVCNGEAPSEAMVYEAISEADVVLCCDGAADMLALCGARADVLVGDFDSLGKARAVQLAGMWNCDVIPLDEHKNKTDAHVAIEAAVERGATEIVLLGALGKRFDHAFANVSLLVFCTHKNVSAVIRDRYCDVYVTCRTMVLPGKPGDLLSILPLGVNSRIRTTNGLAYPLYDHDLILGDSLGVSNVYDADEALVDVASGWVAIVRSWDEPRG